MTVLHKRCDLVKKLMHCLHNHISGEELAASHYNFVQWLHSILKIKKIIAPA